MNAQQIVLLMIMVTVSFNSAAEKIYKTVDESGAVVFSDKKTSGAEKIKVQPNVMEVRTPVMPERTVVESKPRAASTKKNTTQQAEDPQGRGTATAGNLKRKIRNVTNGEGVRRPANLPARGQAGQRAAGGRAGGGRGGGR